MSTVAKPIAAAGFEQRMPPWPSPLHNSGFEIRARRSVPKDVGYCKGGGKPHRICGVCGDRARSLHFGGLSCDSCKAFFRRAVQSGTYKTFQCPHQPGGWNKFCVITVASRKSCQKCRFEACVQIGMEISWVMSEAERQRLLVSRMAKKRKLDPEPAQCSTPSSSTSEPSPPVLLHKSRPLQDYLWPLYPDNVCVESFMCPNEVAIIDKVKTSWTNAMQLSPPTRMEGRDLSNVEIDHSELVRAIGGSIKRFQAFGTPLLDDSEIASVDKKIILLSSMLDLCILRAALNHFRGALHFERYFPSNLHEVHCRFVKGLQELSLDQTTILLFLVVIMLSPDRPKLQQAKKVEKYQEYYLMLLYKYMVGRYGMPKASALYPKLLNKMTDIQELSDCHQEQYLLFAPQEVQSLKEEVSKIPAGGYGCPPSYASPPYENQLTSFDQTFASPVPEAPSQQFLQSPTGTSSSEQFGMPHTSPLSDPNSDAGYMSYEEKPDFFFENMPQCQNNAFSEGLQNTLQQGSCFTSPCSPDVQQLQMPFQFHPNEYNYSEKLPLYQDAVSQAAVLKDFKSENEFSSCLESSLGSSLSSNYGSSPRTLNGEDYFSGEFAAPVFHIEDAAENSSSFFGLFTR